MYPRLLCATKIILCTLVILANHTLAAPALVIGGGGQITGATEIIVVSGSFSGTYDVTFADGTCIDLFTGCDSVPDDLDPIKNHLGVANAELLTLLGSNSDFPELIQGCESTSECYITGVSNINVTANSVSGGTLYLASGPANDLPLSESFAAYRDQDLTLNADRVYAIWTPSTPVDPEVAVPLPPVFTWIALLCFITAAWNQYRVKAIKA